MGYLLASYAGISSTANPVAQIGMRGAFAKWLSGAGMGATWFISALAITKALFFLASRISKTPRFGDPLWLQFALLVLYSGLRSQWGFGPAARPWFPLWFMIGYTSNAFLKKFPSQPVVGLLMLSASFLVPSLKSATGNFLVVCGVFLALYGFAIKADECWFSHKLRVINILIRKELAWKKFFADFDFPSALRNCDSSFAGICRAKNRRVRIADAHNCCGYCGIYVGSTGYVALLQQIFQATASSEHTIG